MNRICKFYTIVNDAQRILFDNYFFPSFPKNQNLAVHYSEIVTTAQYMKDGYIDVLKEKCHKIIESLKTAKSNEIIVWTDIDIIINHRYASELSNDIIRLLSRSKKSILYQKESNNPYDLSINGGFFASIADEFSINLYEKVYSMICNDPSRHDQDYINSLIHSDPSISERIGRLTPVYASVSNNDYRYGQPKRCMLYHTNCTPDLKSKIEMLESIKTQMGNK